MFRKQLFRELLVEEAYALLLLRKKIIDSKELIAVYAVPSKTRK